MASIGASDQYLTEVILALRDQLSGESSRANASMDRLDANANKLQESFGKAGESTDKFGMSLYGLGLKALALNEIRGLILALLSPLAKIGEASDIWKEMSARVGIFNKSAVPTAEIMARIGQIAQESRTPIKEVGALYARLAQGLSESNVSQSQLLTTVQGMADALLISGASAAEAAGAIVQFSQAMASGTLRGEEFNSVAEQAPVILDALAKELGRPKAELRAIAKEGLITSEIMVRAIEGMRDAWRDQANSIPLTIGRAMENLKSAFIEYIGNNENAQATSEMFADALTGVAKNLGAINDLTVDAGWAVFTVAMLKGAAAIANLTRQKVLDERATANKTLADRIAAAQEAERAKVTISATEAEVAKTKAAAENARQSANQLALTGYLTAAERQAITAKIAGAEASVISAAATKRAAEAEVALVESRQRYLTLIGPGVYESAMGKARASLTQATRQLGIAEHTLDVARGRSNLLEQQAIEQTARLTVARETLATADAQVAAAENAAAAAAAKLAAAQAAVSASSATSALSLAGMGQAMMTLRAAAAAFIGYEIGAHFDKIRKSADQYFKEGSAGAGILATWYEKLDEEIAHFSGTYRGMLEQKKQHNAISEREVQTLKAINDATGLNIRSIAEANRAREAGIIIWNDQTKAWEKGTQVIDASNKTQAGGLGQVDAAYADVLKTLDAYYKAQGEQLKQAANEDQARAKLAQSLGQETEARMAGVRAADSALASAEKILANDRDLLRIEQERLASANEQEAKTISAMTVKAKGIALIEKEIEKRKAAVAQSEAQAEAARAEAIAVSLAAMTYGDQADKLDELVKQHAALTEQAGAYIKVSARSVETDKAAADARAKLAAATVLLKDAATDAAERIDVLIAANNRGNQAAQEQLQAQKRLAEEQAAQAEADRNHQAAMDLRIKAMKAERDAMVLAAGAHEREAKLLSEKADKLQIVLDKTENATAKQRDAVQATRDQAAAEAQAAEAIRRSIALKDVAIEREARLAAEVRAGALAAREAADAARARIEQDSRANEIDIQRLELLKDEQQRLKDRANARNDDAAALKAAVEMAQLDVEIAQRQAAAKREEAVALQGRANLLQRSIELEARHTEEQVLAAKAAQIEAEAARVQAARLDEAARAAQDNLDRLKDLTPQQAQLARELAIVNRALEAKAKAARLATDAAMAMLEIDIKAAGASGDEGKALQLRAEAAQKAIALKQDEAKAQAAVLSQYERELALLKSTTAGDAEAIQRRQAKIAKLEQEITVQKGVIQVAEAAVATAKSEALAADQASRSYGDQSASLEQLKIQHDSLSASLSTLNGLMKAGKQASDQLADAESAMATAEYELLRAQTGNDEQRKIATANLEQAKTTVMNLTLAIAEGKQAEIDAAKTKALLAENTRMLIDAAKDAIASVEIEIDAGRRKLTLDQQRIAISRDMINQEQMASEFRIRDAQQLIEITDDQNARQAAVDAIRAEDLRLRELSRQAFESEIQAQQKAAEAAQAEAERLTKKAEYLEILAKATGDYSAAEQAQVQQVRDQAEALTLEAERMSISIDTKRVAYDETERLKIKQEELSAAFEEAGITGVDSVSQVASAIESAANSDSLNQLADALRTAWEASVLSAEEYSALLDKIDQQHDRIKKKPETISRDYEDMFKQYGLDVMSVAKDYYDRMNPMYGRQVAQGYDEWLRKQGAYGEYEDDKTAAEIFRERNRAKQQSPASQTQVPPANAGAHVVKFELPGKTAVIGSFSKKGAEDLLSGLESVASVSRNI